MDLNPVIIAIPIFFGLMSLEMVYEFITKKKTYRLNDAITNLNLGALNQVTGIFTKVVTVGIYTFLFEYIAIVELPQNWISFIALFILYDLCFYWSHRMAHQISLFWGGHVVHHQSEDFNLSVALRQSSTAFIWSMPFYLPLAVLGFQPVQFVLVAGFNLLYQFWIHTEHIDKIGWLEKILNTPSHHRVHHGRDPKYIDKNYAGVFIIWDKIFGTFQEEQERPTYGITKSLNSWNPVYANFAHYIDLFKYTRQSRSWEDTKNMLFKHPGWLPDYLGGEQKPGTVTVSFEKYNADVSFLWAKVYIFIQFIFAMVVTAFFLFNFSDFSMPEKGCFAAWIIYSSVMFGLLFESHSKWLTFFEVVRLMCIPVGIWYIYYGI
ncbi:sterol desaturase family protein [Balneola sp. MJW-20]|uniref:sterol desaturase family protein n=1 Tax=Gracilimonas aurantiaca TaxID=3234185 RepID=UPI003467E903